MEKLTPKLKVRVDISLYQLCYAPIPLIRASLRPLCAAMWILHILCSEYIMCDSVATVASRSRASTMIPNYHVVDFLGIRLLYIIYVH